MKYTKDNPKFVDNIFSFKRMKTFTGVVKDQDDNIVYYLNGKIHREGGPAVELHNGDKNWYLNGELHREDGPAIECGDHHKVWYLNGKLHRTDGPALEYGNGNKYWYLNGNIHRTDGPAITYANGDKKWYLNNKYYGYNNDFIKQSWIRFVELEFLK